MSDQGFNLQLTIVQSYRDWNKVLPSSMAWSLNKVMFVCGVYVLDVWWMVKVNVSYDLITIRMELAC